MKLMFKQRLFSWLDSYDVFDRDGSAVYTVKGELSWGHRLQIYDAQGEHLGTVQEKVLTLLPRFQLYLGDRLAAAKSFKVESGDYHQGIHLFPPQVHPGL